VYAEDKFRFIVGTETYECPIYVAAFLSPKIAQLRFLDRTTNEFEINTDDRNHLFGNILSLGEGNGFSIDKSTLPFVVSLSRELGNDEILKMVAGEFDQEETVEACISRLCSVGDSEVSMSNDVSYLASHFDQVSRSDFRRLSVEHAEWIVGTSSLRLENEDQLFDLISSRVCESRDFYGLFEYVRFGYLSVEAMTRFTELSVGFCEMLNAGIWHRICSRLCYPVSAPKLPSRFVRRPLFSARSGAEHRLNGIIESLTKQSGGNVHDRGLVNITSLSTAGTVYHPKEAANLDADTKFGSGSGENQWLCYGFRTGTINLTGYSIRSQYDCGQGGFHLRHWVIETSMDGNEWTIVDARTDNHELNQKNVTIWFWIAEERHQRCRFVRLRQTGKSHSKSYEIWLSLFEVFGDFFEWTAVR
jgi:hypothetical protein